MPSGRTVLQNSGIGARSFPLPKFGRQPGPLCRAALMANGSAQNPFLMRAPRSREPHDWCVGALGKWARDRTKVWGSSTGLAKAAVGPRGKNRAARRTSAHFLRGGSGHSPRDYTIARVTALDLAHERLTERKVGGLQAPPLRASRVRQACIIFIDCES